MRQNYTRRRLSRGGVGSNDALNVKSLIDELIDIGNDNLREVKEQQIDIDEEIKEIISEINIGNYDLEELELDEEQTKQIQEAIRNKKEPAVRSSKRPSVVNSKEKKLKKTLKRLLKRQKQNKKHIEYAESKGFRSSILSKTARGKKPSGIKKKKIKTQKKLQSKNIGVDELSTAFNRM